MTTSIAEHPRFPSVRERVSPEEWQVRVDLAAAYRLVHLHGWDHLIYNHISARVPGRDEHFLINPWGFCYEEITASSLVKLDLEGNPVDETPYGVNRAGFVIHGAIHGARSDTKCVVHTHSDEGVAIAALEDGLLPISMAAMRFYDNIGYHDYEGPAVDLDEQERLVHSLGPHMALILRNHGLLTVGPNVAAAFIAMYHLQKACQAQVLAQSCGRVVMPTPEARDHPQMTSWRRGEGIGESEWPAMLRRLDRIDSSYRT